MPDYKFDCHIDRTGTSSLKWDRYPDDVLPLWVADMDFPSPPGVIEALHQRVEHGIFGYTHASKEFKEVLVEWIKSHYNWQIQPDWIVFMPGVVSGLNNFCQAFRDTHQQVVVQTPVYPPILHAPDYSHLLRLESALVKSSSDHYEIDFNDFETKIRKQPSQFILCNPQNPTGRVFTESELNKLAEICLKHDTLICSDEIHCDLVFPGHKHIPMASLSPEVANRTITFIAPSKTFNIAGLGCSVAIISNHGMRLAFSRQLEAFAGHVNALGLTAGLAAYRSGHEWLEEIILYLTQNRDYLSSFIHDKLPEIHIFPAEGTFLAWLDCHDYDLEPNPATFFLEKARVALNPGADFGEPGNGFVRLNFGCEQALMVQALDRMEKAIHESEMI
ncbi:MAG: putative C-S lyase [Anaerolinea sp.]|nr:putative C-S lyase [Anaerolinea sp.]